MQYKKSKNLKLEDNFLETMPLLALKKRQDIVHIFVAKNCVTYSKSGTGNGTGTGARTGTGVGIGIGAGTGTKTFPK
jgi:hypothetical protein